MSACTDPATPLVALSGGPKRHQWLFYADWLAQRRSSRRYPLDHPDGACRCYLPTEELGVNTDPAVTRKYGDARVWKYVPPEQWARWGREYRTPEETTDQERRATA
jgi:hypothetical protein